MVKNAGVLWLETSAFAILFQNRKLCAKDEMRRKINGFDWVVSLGVTTDDFFFVRG